MKEAVRELYKRLLLAGRDYPQGLDHVREKAKLAFQKNHNLTDIIEIKKAVAFGRYQVREIRAMTMFHKYRTMKKRYN